VGLLLFVILTSSLLSDNVSLWTIAMIGLGEFLGLRLLANAEQTALALERFASANWLRSMQVAPRIAAIGITYFALGLQTFEVLALAGSLGMLIAGTAATLIARGRIPRFSLSSEGLRQGSWFMGTQLVRASQQNIDRVVLSSLLDPTILAFYSAAQRIVQIGMIPLQAILRLSYPNFFRAGADGISYSARYAMTVLPAALGATALTALALVAVAPLLPLLVGPEFEPSVQFLIYLAPTLPLFALNSTMADTLSGAGHLSLRLLLTATGVVIQALTFALFHDGLQLVWASYCGLGINCLLTSSAVAILTWHEQKALRAAAVAR
jgi:O-antigen/teichoic acid export membrane protein